MKTILDVIETRLDQPRSNCSFTFLGDGETAQSVVGLAEIRAAALKFARVLPERDRVLLLLPPGISFITAFVGCLYARAVAVTSAVPGKNRGIDKIKSIIADAGIEACLTNRDIFENLSNWFGEEEFFGRIRWMLIEEIEREPAEPFPPRPLPGPSEIAFLQYTSGSTGTPKGIMVSHENIVANSEIIRTFFRNDSQSVSVCWLPSFHDMGLIDGVIQPIYSDFQCVLMAPTHFLQKPLRWLKAITGYKATYSGGPNFAYDLCVDRIGNEELAGLDLSSLHCLYNASEPIRARTMRRFLDRFAPAGLSKKQLFACYGLAEATLAASASRLGRAPTVVSVDPEQLQRNRIALAGGEPAVELTASGFAYCDTILKIVDPKTLEDCAPGRIGEIWVAGKSVAAGYWNAPEITAETFVDLAATRFLRTGDLGFLLDGELFVTGRIKDLIIIRGTNHYPQDIEQTVYQAHPALEPNGGAAFSVEIEQEEKLVVVQELKRTFRNAADYGSIFREIVGRISRIHGLGAHDVVLVGPNRLPKTSSGKIQRAACRRLWQSAQLSPLAILREDPFYEKISG